jgi:predicted GIY-YIG superfamily endonuclease
MAWFLYLIECVNGAVYTGIAIDVDARFAKHCSGKGAKYTRANPPKKILATKRFRTRAAAAKEEWRVKQLSPMDKRAFARSLKKNNSI